MAGEDDNLRYFFSELIGKIKVYISNTELEEHIKNRIADGGLETFRYKEENNINDMKDKNSNNDNDMKDIISNLENKKIISTSQAEDLNNLNKIVNKEYNKEDLHDNDNDNRINYNKKDNNNYNQTKSNKYFCSETLFYQVNNKKLMSFSDMNSYENVNLSTINNINTTIN